MGALRGAGDVFTCLGWAMVGNMQMRFLGAPSSPVFAPSDKGVSMAAVPARETVVADKLRLAGIIVGLKEVA